MKKIILAAAVLASMSLASCNDLLDRNRYPEDQLVDNSEFWNSEVNVQGQINYLYQNYNGYGNGTGRNGTFYFESLSDDQVGKWGSDVSFNTWPSNVTPGTSSVWNATYTVLRTCNQIIAGVEASSLANSVKGHYIGQAKLNRAWQYYDLVRHYGDVPLVLVPLNVDSPELYGARTNRNTVMDQVLEDLDYAIANITTKAAKTEFSVDLAWAMKAEICLFEASFAKYHQKDNTRANKFYNEVIKAYDALKGSYELCETYGMIYNSTLKAADGIPSLTANKEVIFMKPYAMGTFCNSISKYTSTNSYTLGMSKDAFDSYLFTDGKPLASTTCNKTDVGVITTTDEGSEHLNIENLLEVRDARLAATIDPYIVYTGYTWSRPNSDGLQSTSGYGVRKFTNPNLPKYYNTTDNQGYLCAPLYWMAEIYLAYAEAKAELGTLTDTDLDNTLNKLWARANIPAQTVASLNAIADPANNMGVSSLIYEIRRCRRAELMMDKGQRYWDLIRWHQLELLDTDKYPNTVLGANISTVVAEFPMKVNANGYMDYFQGLSRKFSEREYLYPIGSNQIALNPELTQNPGWD